LPYEDPFLATTSGVAHGGIKKNSPIFMDAFAVRNYSKTAGR